MHSKQDEKKKRDTLVKAVHAIIKLVQIIIRAVNAIVRLVQVIIRAIHAIVLRKLD